MNEERIVRYTAEEVRRLKGNTDWERIRNMTEDEIEQNALDDPDSWTEEEFANAEVLVGGIQDLVKVPISIRLDADVVDYFKQFGRGYQTRINAVLRAYVGRRRRKG
jgi:uncharacterized protein (DUF4415 family)